MIPKKQFGNASDIRNRSMFGDGFEIKYDTIVDHNTYSWLKVTIEIPRGQTTQAIVLLNGKEIGMVEVILKGKKVQYKLWRKPTEAINAFTEHNSFATYTELGHAVAAIISDFVI